MSFAKCIYQCNSYIPSKIQNIFFNSESSFMPLSSQLHSSKANHSSDFYHHRLVLPIHTMELIQLYSLMLASFMKIKYLKCIPLTYM